MATSFQGVVVELAYVLGPNHQDNWHYDGINTLLSSMRQGWNIEHSQLSTFTTLFLSTQILANFTIGVCSAQFGSTHSNHFLFRKLVLSNHGSSDWIETCQKILLQNCSSISVS